MAEQTTRVQVIVGQKVNCFKSQLMSTFGKIVIVFTIHSQWKTQQCFYTFIHNEHKIFWQLFRSFTVSQIIQNNLKWWWTSIMMRRLFFLSWFCKRLKSNWKQCSSLLLLNYFLTDLHEIKIFLYIQFQIYTLI